MDMEFLCWINRCLFPAGLEKGLVELGMDKDDAYFVRTITMPICILRLYQDWCLHDKFPDGSENTYKIYVDKWLAMMLEKWKDLK